MAAEVPRARDGNIAIQEELCAARAKGTVAAYDLFIARHPQHPLIPSAKAERAQLKKKGGKATHPNCPPQALRGDRR